MGTINKLSKDEIISELQITEYYNDEMRNTLQNIQALFKIDICPNEMKQHGWNIKCDEHYGDLLYSKLCELDKANKIKINELEDMIDFKDAQIEDLILNN